MPRSPLVALRLPPLVLARLRIAAEQAGRTVQRLVVEAVEAAYPADGARPAPVVAIPRRRPAATGRVEHYPVCSCGTCRPFWSPCASRLE